MEVKNTIETLKSDKVFLGAYPFSLATKVDPKDKVIIYTSGSIGVDLSGKLVSDDIKDQTKQVLLNLKNILEDNKSNFENVTKLNIYITDMNNFAAVNEVYTTFFTSYYPARTCVQVAGLPLGAKIEIECVAYADRN